MVMKKCKDCGKEFEQKKTARYPRKFCEKCSAERKKAYDHIDEINIEDCED
jgi:NMD protein affecting ribosome stability and mRNA decay